ncbi:MAG: DUF6125 family protein [bacterium]
MNEQIEKLDSPTLRRMLEDFAKNWLAHDGLWFQAAESRFGMPDAIAMDTEAWEKFTVIEARRIMKLHGIEVGSGLEGLKKALSFRLYAVLNKQEIRNETASSFEFYMVDCRVQSARRRKQMPLFPCKSVGLVEYAGFARTIDPRIRTECIGCPPDPQAGDNFYCGWRFVLK